MVQTVHTTWVHSGEKIIVIEKPHSLNRIFFSLVTIVSSTNGYIIKVSFDDPLFLSYYSLQGSMKYFEAKGEDIFQGNVWVWNNSSGDVEVSTTEILH